MSGVFSALGEQRDGVKNMSTHMLDSILYFAVTGYFTNTQIKARIESVFRELTTDEISDILGMIGIITAATTEAAKNTALEAVRAAINSFSAGALTEAEARTFLGSL